MFKIYSHILLLSDKIKHFFFSDDRGSNSSPLIGFDGTLYVGAGFGVVYAINPLTGGTYYH